MPASTVPEASSAASPASALASGVSLAAYVCGSWATGASPPPKKEGWTPGQATCAKKSSILMIGYC